MPVAAMQVRSVAARLRSAGCFLMLGYLFSHPCLAAGPRGDPGLIITEVVAERVEVVDGAVSSNQNCEYLPKANDIASRIYSMLISRSQEFEITKEIEHVQSIGAASPAALKFQQNVEFRFGADGSSIQMLVYLSVWKDIAANFPEHARAAPYSLSYSCSPDLEAKIQQPLFARVTQYISDMISLQHNIIILRSRSK